jgi:hypothetical protein
LQAPNVCWLPAGTPSVLQKDRRLTNTAEVMEAVADFHRQFITYSTVRQALKKASGVRKKKLGRIKYFRVKRSNVRYQSSLLTADTRPLTPCQMAFSPFPAFVMSGRLFSDPIKERNGKA